MCESDEAYEPLNDGYNWKGDPNGTLSGQDIPQLPPLAATEYDPASGGFVGPDGQPYTDSDLTQTSKEKTWQSMLIPPTAN